MDENKQDRQLEIAKLALAKMMGNSASPKMTADISPELKQENNYKDPPIESRPLKEAVQQNAASRSPQPENSDLKNSHSGVVEGERNTVENLKDERVKKAIQRTEAGPAKSATVAAAPVDERKQRLEMLQQLYFSFDKPVPWMNFLVYPVKVRDYYEFYGAIPCLTINKNEDPKGVVETHLSYAIKKMLDEDNGQYFVQQFIKIMELSLHIKNGIFCGDEECDLNNPSIAPAEDYEEYKDEQLFYRTLSYEKIRKKLVEQRSREGTLELLTQLRTCPCCGKPMRDIYNLMQDDSGNHLMIFNQEINRENYELVRDIIRFMNMLDYNDDYINPELKAELELKAKLQNPNNTPPTLEKQMACIVAGTGYKYDDIYDMTLRRMTYTLREVDALIHYQIMKTSSMSGFVKFKSDIEHWVWGGNEKKGLASEIQRLDNFKQKMSGAG